MTLHDRENAVAVDDFMTIAALYDGAEAKQVSVVFATLDGEHSRRTNRRSEKLFLIQAGQLTVFLADDEPIAVAAGQLFAVPAGETVRLEGQHCEMLIVAAPAFDADDEDVSR